MSNLPDIDPKRLREIAERGVMCAQQFEENLHTTWRGQQGECPFCREDIPWHRGILFQNGHEVAWVCMLCALLEVGARKKQGGVQIGANPVERTVPLPPGFRLVWINAQRITRNDQEPLPTASQIARLFGCEMDLRVWAAAIEDKDTVRLVRPREANEPDSPWRPFLIKGDLGLARREDLLEDYLETNEETTTTKFVHQAIGLDVAELPAVPFESGGGNRIDYPLLDEEILREIPSMNGIQRRACVPRMGLVLKDVWESVKAENPSGIHKHALSCSFDEEYQAYLIWFSSCGAFYYPGDTPPWGTKGNVFMPEVGFGFALQSNASPINSEGLWACVFADALTPE